MKELRKLFLLVADICDGVPYSELQDQLEAAYQEVLSTKRGEKWYSGAIEERNTTGEPL